MNLQINGTILSVFMGMAFSASAQQSVTISSKKVSYQNSDQEQFNRKFDVVYPEISGKNIPLEKVRSSISYWNNFETTLEEVRDDQFTSQLSFEVNYNGKGILDVTLTHSGSTAYPSDFKKHVVVDLATGEPISISSAFQNRTGLYELIAAAHRAEVKEASESDSETAGFIQNALQYLSIYEIQNYTVSDKGVTFLFDYEFARAIRAAQPEGRYFFTWDELKPFISDVGPFRQFLPES